MASRVRSASTYSACAVASSGLYQREQGLTAFHGDARSVHVHPRIQPSARTFTSVQRDSSNRTMPWARSRCVSACSETAIVRTPISCCRRPSSVTGARRSVPPSAAAALPTAGTGWWRPHVPRVLPDARLSVRTRHLLERHAADRAPAFVGLLHVGVHRADPTLDRVGALRCAGYRQAAARDDEAARRQEEHEAAAAPMRVRGT